MGRVESVRTLGGHKITVIGAKFVGQQNAPARRAGPGLPVGFFGVEVELLVEAADGVPGRTADRQTGTAHIAVDALRFGGLAGIQV